MMKVDIQSKEENQLLGRIEARGTVTFQGATPKRYDVLTQVAAGLKVKPEFVVVKKIDTSYGGGHADFLAYAYSDIKVFERVEREYMRKRNAAPEKPVKEEAAEAEKPAAPEKPAEEEAPAVEAPKEETKPEAPAEKPAEKKE